MKITPDWGESSLTQHHLGGMSALTTFSMETRRQVGHTIALLFPPFWPICLTWHITNTISRAWQGDGFIWKPCYSRWVRIHPDLIGFSPVCSDIYGCRPSLRSSEVIQRAEPLRPCELLEYVPGGPYFEVPTFCHWCSYVVQVLVAYLLTHTSFGLNCSRTLVATDDASQVRKNARTQVVHNKKGLVL